MGKVIQTEPPAKRRERILRLLSTLLTVMDFSEIGTADFHDQVAFVFLSLWEIEKTIDETIKPWEKRGYYLKADRFRSEWCWVKDIRSNIENKIANGQWNLIEDEIQLLQQKLSNVKPIKEMKGKRFWVGAHRRLDEVI